jgi:hypothetical protein
LRFYQSKWQWLKNNCTRKLSTAEHHKLAFQQVSDYYEQALQLEVDPSGKDVSRLCFMSYDPDCFRNINAEPFNVNIEHNEPKTRKRKTPKGEKNQPKTEQPPMMKIPRLVRSVRQLC